MNVLLWCMNNLHCSFITVAIIYGVIIFLTILKYSSGEDTFICL